MKMFTAYHTIILALIAFLSSHGIQAQQYAGDVIPNTLPPVPGSEITYFRVKDPSGKNKNLTLVNYYSHQLNGQRLIESQVQRAVVIIHGLNQDPATYESNMLSALSQITSDPNINRSSVAIMAPFFANGDDKTTGYPWTNGLSPGRGSTSNCLVWKASQWAAGANNQYPYTSTNTSSYTVLDQIIQYFDSAIFPNMKQIAIAGHSLGGQTVQRYAAIGQPGNTRSPVTYWVANPNSYVWFSTDRPLSTASCPIYDVYREGYTNFTQYPMTYGVSLVNSGRANILANFNSKSIAYGRGTQDIGDDASTCAPETTGSNRNERFFNFIAAFPPSCASPTGRNCDTIDFVNVGHDAGQMMASPAGQARLFTDNFYGNGSRAYDFGYPRQQVGDDPYPNPALNTTSASINNATYAGNMKYWGCWSDQTSRTLTNLTYTSNANTIETCTLACSQGNNSIAGLEFGTQCFCGSALGYMATEVVESSCATACPGTSSEVCGGLNRLSLFSNGRPVVQPQPGTPETINGDFYIGCYTEATNGRALSGKSTAGSSMSLEYCAGFCGDFKYFGTEYADECYCGNSFAAGASITDDSDCNMICASNNAEFCGAGNRLTVYQNTTWVPPTTTTTAGTGANTPTAGPASSVLSCPDSNSTMVISNGKNFTVECGIDHFGGDLTSLSVSSFQACIDACAQNSQCVDFSLSGSACYLKSSLGSGQTNAAIWGARLATSPSTSTSTSTANTGNGGTSTTSSTSTSSSLTSQSTPAPTQVKCPDADGTVYTASNSETFLIECGIDHAGGDMASKGVDSFAGCIELCATTSGCVDVSMLGVTCYLKSTLGAPVKNGVWGAKLIVSTPTTSSTSPTTFSTSSTTTSTSSTTTSSTITTSSTSSTSSTLSTTTSTSSTSTSTTSSSTSSTSRASSTSTTSSTSATSSSTTTLALPTALPSGYSYVGCFVDENPSRALPNSNGTSSKQTPQQCALNCRASGFKYSGTEYASECWCGNSQPATSAPAADCNMKCSGDATQTCGAGNRLNVVLDNAFKQTFFAEPSYKTWTLMGCYVDSTSARALKSSVPLAASGGPSNATIGNCMDACSAKGYTYCGEEYYSECYGATAAPAGSVASGADPLAAGCNYPCKGNSSQACGGSNRILVYVNNGTSA